MIYFISWVLFTAFVLFAAKAYNKKASDYLKVKLEPYALSAGFGLVLMVMTGV